MPVSNILQPFESLSDLIEGFTNNEIIRFFKNHEGEPVNYMYRDTEGFPTIGIGHLIQNANHAAQLDFQYGYDEHSRRPATEEQIRYAYERLPSQYTFGKKKTARAYEPRNSSLSPLYMSKTAIDQLLIEDIKEHKNRVVTKVPQYNDRPAPARKALLDMQFNMGENFSREKWPKLFEALDFDDYEAAAFESRRPQVGDRRNNEIFDLFLDALFYQ